MELAGATVIDRKGESLAFPAVPFGPFRGAATVEHGPLADRCIVALARAAKTPVGRLSDRKSDPDEALFVSALKPAISVSNAWLAQGRGIGMPTAASQFVPRRFRTQSWQAELEALLSKVKP